VSAHQPSRLSRVKLDREPRQGPLLGEFACIRALDRAMRDADHEPRLVRAALEDDVPNLHRTLFAQKERPLYGAANGRGMRLLPRTRSRRRQH
jgi:hypothetical protein